MYKMFSLVPPKKPVTRKNWDKLSFYFSIFLMMKFTVMPKKPFGIWHLAKLVFWSILSFKNWKVNTYFARHSELEWNFSAGFSWGVKYHSHIWFLYTTRLLRYQRPQKDKKGQIFFKGLSKGHRSIL